MHTSVRKYKLDTEQMPEVVKRVDGDFAAKLEAMEGFVGYELLDCGYGILMTITTCQDRHAAERSNELAAEWVSEALSDIDIERVEATIGEVGVSRALDEMLEPTHA